MRSLISMLTFSFIMLAAINLHADRRYFARSYTAYTLPQGALELEIWNTGRIGKNSGFYYRFQPRMEFEYGLTDRLTSSFYLNFSQVKSAENNFSSKPFEFSSTAIELRYRLTEPGELFIDPALYFEFAYGGDEIEYELKGLFSKRWDNWVAAVNLNTELERDIIGNKNESSFEVTGGLFYEINPSIGFGVEFRNHRVYESIYKTEEANATFVGPTVNFQAKSFYLTFNFLTQVAGSPASNGNLDLLGHEMYEFRTILGIEL